MLEVLGIHSNAVGTDAVGAGHAWLSMHFSNGRETTIGLWTTSLFQIKRLVKDPTGAILDESFDVNIGLEKQKGYVPKASRFYKLDPAQAKRAVQLMGSYQSWRVTNTCASWARSVVKELLNEDLNASDLAGATETPRALGKSILELESRYPTSLRSPKLSMADSIAKAFVA